MSIDDEAVKSAVGRLSQYELDRMEMHEALELIVDALPSLFAIDGAGILLLDDEQQLRHVASSDGAAQVLETVQEEHGRGPCVTSMLEDEFVTVNDIGADERWPELAAPLLDKGIRGILGAPIHIAGAAVGSLNVYHGDAHQWDESDRSALLAFGRIIESLLSTALSAARREAVVEQLSHALSTRVPIDRAVGYLMGVHGLDAEDAFDRLRRAARSSRRPVSEVAADVLAGEALE